MIDQTWVVIIAQLVVTLYLAWKVNRLSNEAEMMQVIVGSILMDMEKLQGHK